MAFLALALVAAVVAGAAGLLLLFLRLTG